ncbi:helix-turn-helix domain-containing protein [Ramlibacter alkalitolerans]|uniref:Helix-turn-helix transcriptional regulator n=2 Tax=Ramlibacter alkalitolerans TaxID=2039631 RepID=A0ABS1JU89_9BURK|nr:helix-turn-helix transcriptional regulator [Ramlibacter alkalitolerans]
MRAIAADLDPQAPKSERFGVELSKEELGRPGGMLFAALLGRAAQRGDTLKDVADQLGCTYSYLSQLRTGARKVQQISDELVDGLSQYLGWPRLAVLIAAAKIRPDDIMESPLRLPAMLNSAIDLIRSDPVYGPWFPASLLHVDDAAKHFIVRLYEDASGQSVLPYDGPEE